MDRDLGVDVDLAEIADVVGAHPRWPGRWSTCTSATG